MFIALSIRLGSAICSVLRFFFKELVPGCKYMLLWILVVVLLTETNRIGRHAAVTHSSNRDFGKVHKLQMTVQLTNVARAL